jgi:acyl-CoA thioesterase-2
VFGGQTIAQSLVAATRTVEPDRRVHSLHGYFMLGGDPKAPIVYEVDRIRDGGSFTTRRVVAIQHGHAIFRWKPLSSYPKGFDHQVPIPPDVPSPDSLPSQQQVIAQYGDKVPEGIRRYWERERPIEMKQSTLEHYTSREKLAPRRTSGSARPGRCPTTTRRNARFWPTCPT